MILNMPIKYLFTNLAHGIDAAFTQGKEHPSLNLNALTDLFIVFVKVGIFQRTEGKLQLC